MKNFVLYFLLVILVGETVYLAAHSSKSKEKVLAESTIAPLLTPSLLPLPSDTPTPTAVPTPKPTPKPATPTPVPQPTFSSQQIYEFTERFAGQYGVDPNVIRHIAICESGFKPNAKYIKYIGLFQFDAPTWKSLRLKMGEDPDPNLRANAEEAVQTAAYAISIGKRYLWPNCNP